MKVFLDNEERLIAAEAREQTRLRTAQKKREYMRTDRAKELKRINRAHRRKNDPAFRINNTMSCGINAALKKVGTQKTGPTWQLLPYSKSDLMSHLESQFTTGMSWDNYRHDGWHIDHRRPVASFNFDSTDHPDFKKCWALNNLQPLWAGDNMRKHAKWNGEVNA